MQGNYLLSYPAWRATGVTTALFIDPGKAKPSIR
jgi:hypothetical protein